MGKYKMLRGVVRGLAVGCARVHPSRPQLLPVVMVRGPRGSCSCGGPGGEYTEAASEAVSKMVGVVLGQLCGQHEYIVSLERSMVLTALFLVCGEEQGCWSLVTAGARWSECRRVAPS